MNDHLQCCDVAPRRFSRLPQSRIIARREQAPAARRRALLVLTGKVQREETLMEHPGLGVIMALAIPVVLTALSVLTRGFDRVRWVRGVCAVLLVAFAILTSFSIGLFYLPSAIAMIISAALP